jgi:glycosyltransferase involved in cell wall biosynthesis
VTVSVVIITHNEETNIRRTLTSVQPLIAGGKGEIIVVDSGSSDRTVEIATSFGANVFVEEWKGYAAQKNSAIDKASGDWILSLDADEEVESDLAAELASHEAMGAVAPADRSDNCWQRMDQAELEWRNPGKIKSPPTGYWIPRKNYFLGRWIKHGGFWPDPKLRLFRRGAGIFEDRMVHEDVQLAGSTSRLRGALLHHSYPTLADYLEHMNRYSSLGAEMLLAGGRVRFSAFNTLVRPIATFVYNYFFRLGFLDGPEGLLLHLYHAVYVSWKYAKAWELGRQRVKADSSLRSE